jgi:hypothetical protein
MQLAYYDITRTELQLLYESRVVKLTLKLLN